jgi:hypothetical protein
VSWRMRKCRKIRRKAPNTSTKSCRRKKGGTSVPPFSLQQAL